ncbi:MAG: hypothetical protein ACXWTK_00880 [Methylobacter sp.]
MKAAIAGKVLTHSEIEKIRCARGRSMLLFITDRCPVGCEHCSVDSRRDSPTISDFGLFGDIVDWICFQPNIEVVGISGGEPFIERRGLTLASCRFTDAGKQQVIYTSGVWATTPTPPRWISDVLTRCSCIYLSTDPFHARLVDDDHFVRAAQAIVVAGAWIVVQVLNYGRTLNRVERLLHNAFGNGWAEYAEINIIEPLTNGRGSNIFTSTTCSQGHTFGSCSLGSPMVRYDGLVTGCCNESVIQNMGPSRLRQYISSTAELSVAVQNFHDDSLLSVIGGAGLGVLTEHPRFADLAEQQFTNNCQLCWKILDRMPHKDNTDRLIQAISALPTDG